MKFILSLVSILSVGAIRPQPEFTLRSPEEMTRPLPTRGRPMPEHLNVPESILFDDRVGRGVDLPHGDPKPKRPPKPEPARLRPAVGNAQLSPFHDEDFILPTAPRAMEHGRPAIRGLHADHHHDGKDTIQPFPLPKRPPVSPHKPKPLEMGGAKPKPQPKAKPKPEPKRKVNSLMQEPDVDMMTFETQQQCQMDYARLCSPVSSYAQFHQIMPRPQDSLIVDFFVVDEVDVPCDLQDQTSVDGDDDDAYEDDDDAYDDDGNDVIVAQSPLMDIVENMFSSFGFATPLQPRVPIQSTRSVAGPIPNYASRSLRLTEPNVDPMDTYIGFGFDGDMCLLDNFELLSPQCKSSINNLQVYIDEIDVDDDSGCHLLPFILLLLLFSLLLRCIARRRMMRRQDSLHKTLAAIHASPELKAKVEAASGIPVPPTLPACRARTAMAQQPWYVKVCCVVGLFGMCVLLSITAMLITGAIVNGIYDNDSDDDNASPIVVLAILFCVLTVEVLLVKRLRMAICAYLNSPSQGATASSGTSSNGSEVSGSFRLPEVFQRMRSVQISSLLPSRSRSFSSSSSGPQYEPLLSEEEKDDTELVMVRVPASAPPAMSSSSCVTTIPVVVSPIDASSNVQSSISML